MKRSRTVLGKIAIALALLATASAQTPNVPDPPDAPAQARDSGAPPYFRFGSSLELRAGDRAEDIAVILGSATINGTVEGDVVVVLGSLELGSTSVIEGDAVVVGGSIEVLPGAVAEGDLVVVGGALDAPVEFSPGGELAVVGVGAGPTDAFAPAFAWLTKGLLWGRPLVPELLWTWILVAVFALLYLATNSIFERPVRDVASALASKPLTCFLVGGLVVLLIGPVSLLLVMSVVGLPAVPLLWFAACLTVVLGKVGVTRWIGGRVMPEQFPGDRAEAARSVAISDLRWFALPIWCPCSDLRHGRSWAFWRWAPQPLPWPPACAGKTRKRLCRPVLQWSRLPKREAVRLQWLQHPRPREMTSLRAKPAREKNRRSRPARQWTCPWPAFSLGSVPLSWTSHLS